MVPVSHDDCTGAGPSSLMSVHDMGLGACLFPRGGMERSELHGRAEQWERENDPDKKTC